MIKNGFKRIYNAREFVLGLAAEFGSVLFLLLAGYIICIIITGR